MARDLKARVVVKAKDEASKPVGKARASFVKLGDFLKSAAFLGAIAAVGVGVKKVIDSFKEWTAAAVVQEDALVRLKGALAPLGDEAEKVRDRLAAQASALQLQTKFGDEAIIAAQSQLALFTREEESLKKLTEATLDFATAMKLDLSSAANLLGKTIASPTNALVRYGVEVEGAVGSTERLNSIVENSAELFGGAAKAALDTYSGAVQQLENAEGDLSESLGFTLTKSNELREAIDEERRSIERLILVVDGADVTFGKLGAAAAKVRARFNDYKALLLLTIDTLVDYTFQSDAAGEATEELSEETEKAAAREEASRRKLS